jgi:DNA replication protein DnaC
MQQTLEKLRELRLGGFVSALLEQAESKQYQDLSFEERLGFLVEKEYTRRENLRLQNRLRKAKLRQAASLDQVDFEVKRGLPKAKFMELAQCGWLRHHHNLILLGPTGVGKSFLASVLGDQACKLGYNVRYIKMQELLAEILQARADGSFKSFWTKLQKNHLLIIDEWLRDPLSAIDSRELLDLLDERYRKASCLFTTQLPVTDWYRHIPDPTLAEAILDRVVHDSLRLELQGESMRKLTTTLTNGKKRGGSVASLR